jgi:DNA-binding transcriptional LysR family regulator
LIGTVLLYVEAGEGVGIVPESVATSDPLLRFVPLTPAVTTPLVLGWSEDEDPPPVRRFRELVIEWQKAGRLWKKSPAGAVAQGKYGGGRQTHGPHAA